MNLQSLNINEYYLIIYIKSRIFSHMLFMLIFFLFIYDL